MKKKNINFLLALLFIGILSLAALAAPVNDDFANAMNITDEDNPNSVHLNSTNGGATIEAGEQNHAGLAPSGTVWYKWVAVGSKGIQLSLRSSQFDTVVAVYAYNQANNLVLVTENNDISASNNRSHVSFFAVALKTYYIAVGNGPTSGAGGTIRLDLAPSSTRSSADFDGDGATDIGVYRPSDNTYYILSSRDGNMISHRWGSPGDIVVPGNLTQNFKPAQTDFTVFRPSTGDWHTLSTDAPATTLNSVHFGHAGDVPFVGNFTGSADPDVAIFRPSDSTWYVQTLTGSAYSVIKYGLTGDIPLRGDYDGDGLSDIAVFRPSDGAWYIRRSRNGQFQAAMWGQAGDIPVSADINADGYYDYVLFRPSTGNWHIMLNGTNTTTVLHWGTQGDIPIGGVTVE